MRVEVGEGRPLREAAVISHFNPHNPRDIRAIERLDLGSLYAYNPFAAGESNPHRPMTARERRLFAKSGDENHITLAIANSKDASRWKIGDLYFSRTDPDDVVRLPGVQSMAREAGMDITNTTKIFDFNFDTPHRPKDYVPLNMSAVKQGIEIFFRTHPKDATVFFIDHDDLTADPDDYNIMIAMGATDIGQMIYDPGEGKMNHVLYLDKSHFEHRVRQNAKMPKDHAGFKQQALADLERRATRGIR